MKTNILILFVFCAIFPHFSASSQPLRVPGVKGEPKLEQYLFQEIVKRSDQFDTLIHAYPKDYDPNPAKLWADLEIGIVDIAYSATSIELEAKYSAVFIPLYRGLMGMRLGIVKTQNRDILKSVGALKDLNRFTVCQGKTWPDTFILEANNIKIAKSLKYPNLFLMLEGGRCDFFPRGMFEPYKEVKRHPDLNMFVDENILLRYKMPFYFFTSKDNRALADHITKILMEMVDDGTYSKLFMKDPNVYEALQLSNLERRVIFELNNPFLTAESLAVPDRLFFDPLNKDDL